jgi:hypothetical protein
MSHVDHMVSHSGIEGTEKVLGRAFSSRDLRRGKVNGGLSRSHNE